MKALSKHCKSCDTSKEKLLVFFGSPHFNGNTKKLLNYVMDKLNRNYDFFVVDSYKIQASPCVDCGYCKKYGRCRINDLNGTFSLLEQVSKIMVATPVYNCSFPAPLKAIFDRFQVYFNLKSKRINNTTKNVFFLFTCGSYVNRTIIASLLIQCKYIFKSLNAKISDFSLLDGTDEKNITCDILQKCCNNVVKGLLEKKI